jgi:hypothetical protein
MVQRITTKSAEKRSDSDNLALYQTGHSSFARTQSRDSILSDDLIVSLADAYENKRARQVTEWEQLRRQNVHQAV